MGLIYRHEKGIRLTTDEVDGNFLYLEQLALSGSSGSSIPLINTYTRKESDEAIKSGSLIVGGLYAISDVDRPLYDDGTTTGTYILLHANSTASYGSNGIGRFFNPVYTSNAGYGIWTDSSSFSASNLIGEIRSGDSIYGNEGAARGIMITGLDAYSTGITYFLYSAGDWDIVTRISAENGSSADVADVNIAAYDSGSTTIYGGYVWVNNTGAVGSTTSSLGFNTASAAYFHDYYTAPTMKVTEIHIVSDNTGTSENIICLYPDNTLYLSELISNWNNDNPEHTVSLIGSIDLVLPDTFVMQFNHGTDTDWVKLPYSSGYYDMVYDEIEYDYTNDMIVSRRDTYGNSVTEQYSFYTLLEAYAQYSNRAIAMMQWGNPANVMNSQGVGSNTINNAVLECVNYRGTILYGNIINNTIINPADYDMTFINVNGLFNVVRSNSGFAHGSNNNVYAENASAFGHANIAVGENQFVIGKFNKTNPSASFIIGNGGSDDERSNTVEVYNDNVSFNTLVTLSETTASDQLIPMPGSIIYSASVHFGWDGESWKNFY